MAKAHPRVSAAGERLLPSASPPQYLDSRSHADADADSYVILVRVQLRRLRRRCRCRCLAPLVASLAPLALGFLLWPADPDISVARLRLAHISFVAQPAVALNISATLKVRVRNPDFFALDYSRLDVAIGYPGARRRLMGCGGGDWFAAAAVGLKGGGCRAEGRRR